MRTYPPFVAALIAGTVILMHISEGYGQDRSIKDCRTATTAADVAVCGDQQLARLDRELGRLYGQHFSAATGVNKAQLKEDLRVWLAERDKCGSRQVCLNKIYQAFIDYLKASRPK